VVIESGEQYLCNAVGGAVRRKKRKTKGVGDRLLGTWSPGCSWQGTDMIKGSDLGGHRNVGGDIGGTGQVLGKPEGFLEK
jgi:hypothetical protein